jgi:hypothetical protein
LAAVVIFVSADVWNKSPPAPPSSPQYSSNFVQLVPGEVLFGADAKISSEPAPSALLAKGLLLSSTCRSQFVLDFGNRRTFSARFFSQKKHVENKNVFFKKT